jgi:hypothetical protein
MRSINESKGVRCRHRNNSLKYLKKKDIERIEIVRFYIFVLFYVL